jgi:sec-independent protein translocase protein TatC
VQGGRAREIPAKTLPFWKKVTTIPLPSHPVSEFDDHSHTDETIDLNAPREKAMGFWQHLEELRGTIIKSVVVFIVFATGVGIWMKEFNDVLMQPLMKVHALYPQVVMDLGTTTIMEGFNVVIQMCVLGGLALSLPFILFFVGQFVAPALSEKEMKAVLPLGVSAVVLFLMGAAFAFYLLIPSTLRVSVEINEMFGYSIRWTPASYYSLLTWLVLGVGASFEFPLLIVLLVWLGVMTTAFLRKYRRHAIVVIFIIAAIVTPTPDPFTQTMFAGPLYVLYEIAIIASSRIEKRKKKLQLFGDGQS